MMKCWSVRGPILIAHALGGVDSNTYTNSLEAFQQSYKNGFRVFETDVMEAGDGSLVLFHTLGSMTSEFVLSKRIRDIGKTNFSSLNILINTARLCLKLSLACWRHMRTHG